PLSLIALKHCHPLKEQCLIVDEWGSSMSLSVLKRAPMIIGNAYFTYQLTLGGKHFSCVG
ncbi:hypothetical protein, partial [Rodentibacter caecimuris]|uniref:hypothetical protein n=1 Tax=Rodentibacter caecimuris TaxID=1796644 RepID=UPI00258F62AC